MITAYLARSSPETLDIIIRYTAYKMKIELTHTLENFSNHSYYDLKTQLEKGYVIYSLDRERLKILDSASFELINELSYPDNLSINLIGDNLYSYNKGVVQKLNLESNQKEIITKRNFKVGMTGYQYRENLLVETNTEYENYQAVKKKTELIDTSSNQILCTIEGVDYDLVKMKDSFFLRNNKDLSYSKYSKNFNAFDYNTIIEGTIQLSNICYYGNYGLIITSQNNKYSLHKLDLKTGVINWAVKCFGNKIYLFENRIFQIAEYSIYEFNIDDGNQIDQININEYDESITHLSSHLSDLSRSKLCFTSHQGNSNSKKAFLSKFGIMDNSYEKIEIDILTGSDHRCPLGRPFVTDKAIYIDDSTNTLRKYKYAV